jgi:hypothetical protein
MTHVILMPCQLPPTGRRPSYLGIGADPGHLEHHNPSTRVPTEASGWRSMVRRSIARLVLQPGQKTSSQTVPASSAALMVDDHSMSWPVASRRDRFAAKDFRSAASLG